MPSKPSTALKPKVQPSRVVGRYIMYGEIASGGMASVHLGRLCGAVGFSRIVAVKHLHPHFARDSEFVSMFLDEVRLVSRIKHPNVAAPLDVVLLEESEEIFLVMEYIHGATLARLFKSALALKATVPPAISANIMSGALHGLHAAHEAVDEFGSPLNIVHRDVSPHNIMVGTDGVPRVLDFGVAKAVSRIQSTQQGQVKGKVAYMAPEQMTSVPVDRRADIFAAGIVFWEALTLERLFEADNPAHAVSKVLSSPIAPPSSKNPNVPPALDSVVLKALDRDVERRFQTAIEFAEAIEEAIRVPTARRVGEWVVYLGGEDLAKNSERLAAIESSSPDTQPANGQTPQDRQATQAAQAVRKRPETYSDVDAISTVILAQADVTPAPVAESEESGTRLLSRSRLLLRWLSTRRKQGTIIAGALALVVAVVVVGLVRLPSRNHAQATVNAAIPPLGAGPSGASSKVVDLPQVVPIPVVAAVVEPAKHTRTGPGKSSAKSTGAPWSASHRATKKTGCNPPFYVDAQGIRRVKPECL